MINKTSFDIRQYSEEVIYWLDSKITKTTTKVQNAADLFGTDFNTDLRVKINRCKPIVKDVHALFTPSAVSKRKISTSNNQRKNYLN